MRTGGTAIKRKRKLRFKIIFFTIVVCISALSICGAAIFATAVTTLSEKIMNDIVFFLNETNGNLNDKSVLLEDTLLSLRNDSTIESYLDSALSHGASPYTEREVATQFQRCVNIFSDKNASGDGGPFFDRAYLFAHGAPQDRPGYYKSLYYSYLLEEETALDAHYRDLARTFSVSGREVSYYPDGEGADLVIKLYSHEMENFGTLVFHLSTDAIKTAMANAESYEDSFWFVYNKDGKLMASSEKIPSEQGIAKIAATYRSAPYECETDGKTYIVSTARMSMGLTSTIAVPKDQMTATLYSSAQVYLLLMLILVPAIVLLAFLVTYRLTAPLKTVTDKIKLVGEGQFETKLPDFNSQEFSEISEVFNQMTEEIRYLITDVYQKKLAVQGSELKFLQSQMNPHFMFNVLSTIAIKARLNGDNEVYEMIHSFAQLTQARIYRSDNDKVPLHEELRYIRYYLSLQNLRFGDKLSYDIDCDDDSLLHLYIPKLCVEPIVENAVVHGLEPKRGKGALSITVRAEEGDLAIRVADDGVGFDTDKQDFSPSERGEKSDETHNNVGLYNAHQIVRHFYGAGYGVTIHSVRGEGSVVTIRLPFDTGGGKTEADHV